MRKPGRLPSISTVPPRPVDVDRLAAVSGGDDDQKLSQMTQSLSGVLDNMDETAMNSIRKI